MYNSIIKYQTLVILCFLSLNFFGQSPQSFNYQTIVKDGIGDLVVNHLIGVRVTISQGDSPDIQNIYEERFSKSTDSYGVLNLKVGTGTVAYGVFSEIDWSLNTYSIETAYDFHNGSTYVISQTSPLNSLPLALHSTTSGGVKVKNINERALLTPVTGSTIYCSDCGNGEFQVFNGSEWVNALGQVAQNESTKVQSITIIGSDPYVTDEEQDDATVLLQAEILPVDAFDKSVTWSTNDSNIATINEEGILTLKNNGEIFITAAANDGSGAEATLNLIFQDNRPSDAVPSSIYVVGDNNLLIGEERTLAGILDPLDLMDNNATWSSSNENVLTVTVISSGNTKGSAVITGITAGTAEITVTSGENNALQNTHTVEVFEMPVEEDTEKPIILVEGFDGENSLDLQRGNTTSLPSVSATDNVDGSVAVTSEQDFNFSDDPFNGELLSQYRMIYSATDAAGNLAKDSILINVVDKIAPVLVIENNYQTNDTIRSTNISNYVLPIATAIDDDGSAVSVVLDDDGYSASVSGIYRLLYSATDPQNNVATDSIYVVLEDKIAPTIKYTTNDVPIVNNEIIPTNLGSIFSFPEVSSIDDNGDILSVGFDKGDFDVNTKGDYTVIYTSTDNAGNTATINVIYQVSDLSPPEITNEEAFMNIVFAAPIDAPRVIGQILAEDNVGVVSYKIEEFTFNDVPYTTEELNDPNHGAYYEAFTGGDYGGSVTIDNTGVITVSKSKEGFSSEFEFLVTVEDAVQQKDTLIVKMFHASDGNLNNVQIKELNDDDWLYAGERGSELKTLQTKAFTIKEESAIGEDIFFMRVYDTDPVNIKIDNIGQPTGPGSTDFEIVAYDSQAEISGKIYSLKVKNSLNTTTQSLYNLNILLEDNNGQSTCLPIELNIKKAKVLVPEIDDIVKNVSGNVIPYEAIQIKDFLFSTGAKIADASNCPLSLADGVFDTVAELQETLLSSLPIISNDRAKELIKQRLKKLPKYFWLHKDGNLTRISFRFPVKTKTVDVEYVIDPDRGGCYWGVILDKFKPSEISGKLSFLDDKDIKPGIVVTTLEIDENDFECIRIPCMTLKPENGETVSVNVVATGQYLKNVGNTDSSGLFNAIGYGVAPWPTNFADLFSQKLTIGMKANFSTAFDQKVINQFQEKTAQAQIAVNTLIKAKKEFDAASRKYNFAQRELDALNLKILPFSNEVNRLRGSVSKASTSIFNFQLEIAQTLLKDQICTSPCIIPCIYWGWCRWGKVCYGCVRSCGCEVRSPEVCIPNPAAKLAAKLIGEGALNDARRTLRNAQNSLNAATNRLASADSPREALNAGFESALDAFNLATQALATAQNAVDAIGDNKLIKLATYLINHGANQTVATANASFVTTIDSANSGSFMGDLTLDVSLLNLPKFSLTINNIGLTGNQILNTASTVADKMIDKIIP